MGRWQTVVVALAVLLANAPRVDAAVVICQRKGKLRLRLDACKPKETAVDAAQLGVTGPPGAAGTPGAAGAPGELRIYGDGSAGALSVTGSQHLTDLVPDANLQFTSVSIATGATLFVPSGVVIRCTETFVNEGTLNVDKSASPGSVDALSNGNQFIPRQKTPHPGVATAIAGQGGSTTDTGWEAGSTSGLGDGARFIFHPGPAGGGAGMSGPRGGGGLGGGALTVLARQAITNAGTIAADGDDGADAGASGSGGGFVILASMTQILHQAGALISAKGGVGGSAGDRTVVGVLPDFTAGAGGGGGGGCVHLLAPAVTNAGTVVVDGGAAGSVGALTLRTLRVGGSGGGASCGFGGSGGRIPAGSAVASAGTIGRVFVTLADPTALF